MGDFKQLSAESIPLFKEGISLTLSNWDALDAGISNGFGNLDQVQNLATRIFDFFHQPNRREQIYIDDLEDLLWDGMGSLGIVAEDGSIEEVAEDLMIMHSECLEHQYQSILKLREVKKPSSAARQIITASDDDEDEDDDASDMMVDSQGSLPNANSTPVQKSESSPKHMGVDEDGWVTVPSRKNRGRNH